MAKLVDALDLGPSNLSFESSSLSIRNRLIYLKILTPLGGTESDSTFRIAAVKSF